VVIPRQNAMAVAGPAARPASISAPATCTAAYNEQQQCALVVDLDATPAAHLVVLPTAQLTPITAVGSGDTTSTILVGSVGCIAEYGLTTTGATLIATETVPGAGLVEGFSPTGRQVLYLRNHGPIQLWAGTVGTHITPRRELLANADLQGLSW
jgi:hypothetical protein